MQVLAKCIGDVIDAYVPPVLVILETQQRYSLRSLGLPEDNFNIITGGDDFDADNNTVSLTLMTVAEILEGGNAAAAGMTCTEMTAATTTSTKTTTGTKTTKQQQQQPPPPQKKSRRGHLTTFVDAVSLAAQKF